MQTIIRPAHLSIDADDESIVLDRDETELCLYPSELTDADVVAALLDPEYAAELDALEREFLDSFLWDES